MNAVSIQQASGDARTSRVYAERPEANVSLKAVLAVSFPNGLQNIVYGLLYVIGDAGHTPRSVKTNADMSNALWGSHRRWRSNEAATLVGRRRRGSAKWRLFLTVLRDLHQLGANVLGRPHLDCGIAAEACGLLVVCNVLKLAGELLFLYVAESRHTQNPINALSHYLFFSSFLYCSRMLRFDTSSSHTLRATTSATSMMFDVCTVRLPLQIVPSVGFVYAASVAAILLGAC